MPLIECTLGSDRGPQEISVAGRNYAFALDKFGRYVTVVDHMEAEICFLAVEHYRKVPDVPDATEEQDDEAPAPIGLTVPNQGNVSSLAKAKVGRPSRSSLQQG